MWSAPLPLATLALGCAVATGSAGSKTPRPRKLPRFPTHRRGDAGRAARLRAKLLAKATPAGERRLQNGNDYGNGNGNGNSEYDARQGYAEGSYGYDAQMYDAARQKYPEGYEGYDPDYYRAPDYGFQPANFALSYHRCAAVREFDDNVAARGGAGGVFATKNFAILRFCPVETCDAESRTFAYGNPREQYRQYNQGQGSEYQPQEAANGQANYQQGQYYQSGQGAYDPQQAYNDAANDQANYQQGNGNGYQQQQDNGRRRAQYQEGAGSQYGYAPQDGTVYGAQGKGCQKNYGEYIIELDDYLSLMLEHQQERATEYCDFCDNYMYQVYQNYVKDCDGNDNCRRRRALKYDEFQRRDWHDHRRELANYDMGACTPYQDVCGEDALEDPVVEYFDCTQAANGVYIGPHCADDGFTVTLAAYADEQCQQWLPDVDASWYVGESLEYDALKSYYNSKHGALDVLFEGEEESLCIPCQRQDDEFDAMLEDYEEVNYNVEMSDLCQHVYDESAHCHRHYKSFSKRSMSKLEYQEAQLTCDFIDSVDMGNYDEMGYINLKSTWNYRNRNNNPEWVQDNMQAAQFMENARNSALAASPLQIFFLIFSILACCALAVWSKRLHTSLTKEGKRAEWAPGRSWNPANAFRRQEAQPRPEPGAINPTDSGIGASRVRSDNSYYLT